MNKFDVKTMLDPVRTAREEGRQIGRREMRDQIHTIYAAHAATHHNPEIRAELWTFIKYIERMATT